MKRRHPAVVLAADINGLGAVRSLHAEGVETIALATRADDPVLQSRLPVRKVQIPDDLDPAHLLRALDGLELERPALIPTSDQFVGFMLRYREVLSRRFGLCLPDDRVVSMLLDKELQTEAVAALGIPLPRTVRQIAGPRDPRLLRLELPVIFKPRSFATRSQLGRKNVVVQDAPERDRFLRSFSRALSSLVAQEVVPGGDDTLWVCNCTFDRQHELIGAFTFRRLRMAPMHYGVTSYAISERNDTVVEMVSALGRQLRYVGPAMFEFKFDVRDGQYKYIEVNPRLGMCNAFDARCGVNNVLSCYQLAVGEPPTASSGQQEGVMFLSLWEDLHGMRQGGKRVLSALRQYAEHLGRPHVGAYFSWCDPGPAVAVAARQIGRGLRGMLRRVQLPAIPVPAASEPIPAPQEEPLRPAAFPN